VQRGEINYTSEGLTGYTMGGALMAREGVVVPLYQDGLAGPDGVELLSIPAGSFSLPWATPSWYKYVLYVQFCQILQFSEEIIKSLLSLFDI
jgi:hypothetical protein